MNLTLLLDMLVEGMPDRVIIGDRDDGLTPVALQRRAHAGAQLVRESSAKTLLYLAGNGPAFPIALFSASYAGVPFLPINFRLSQEQLADVLRRHPQGLVVTDDPERIGDQPTITIGDFLARTADGPSGEVPIPVSDPDAIAVLLMTSGTTAAPKSAALRHRHLIAYILGSVEFMASDGTDAAIVAVPPYHVAGLANLLSNLYSGRRIVYLDQFTPCGWLDKVTSQGVTHAMVVPTMLVRIVEELNARRRRGDAGQEPVTLRALAYGGAKIAVPVLADALRLFPATDFVNAYGLTETASSIAVLTPQDHRSAIASEDPDVRARLSSVGRPLPTVEIEIHDDDGKACPSGVIGNIMVRGDQVAGEYLETGSRVTEDGWFPTRDHGYLDGDGYLFVLGRADDTIIRGGENIAPSEIEAVLQHHPDVADCAVAGIPDDEWGQRIAAFVVAAPGAMPDVGQLRDYVRSKLRSSKTPDRIVFLSELPVTPTGKVLRRNLVEMIDDSATLA